MLGQGFIVTDPVNIEAVLNSQFEDFVSGSRREGLFPLLGEGIFIQDGQAWKDLRELLRRQFFRIKADDVSLLEVHTESLLANVRASLARGADKCVDLQPHFLEYTLGTTLDIQFGAQTSSISRTDLDAFRGDFDYASLIQQ